MKCIALAEKQQLETVTRKTPRPGAGEALIRLSQCGICGSDLHAWNGRWSDDYRLGHEFCGIVEDVGEGVEHIDCGMRVTGECFGHCGECASCQAGHYNHCEGIVWKPSRPEGALSEKFCYRAEALYPLPDQLNDRQVALVEPTAVALHAMDRGQVSAGKTVAIIGAGTIGLLCAAVARVRQAKRVFIIAKYDQQAELAREMGATDVVRHGEEDPRKVIPEAVEGVGIDVCIDSVAAGTSFSTALALTRPMGRMVEVGGITRPLMAALDPLVSREVTITGSNCYGAARETSDFARTIDLIADGAIQPEKLVTYTFPLTEAQEAFETASDKESGAVKVVVTAE